MELLREKIVGLIYDVEREAGQGNRARFVKVGNHVVLPWKADLADRILDIPEIRDALAEQRLNAMSPAQFGEKLLGELPSGPPSTAARSR